MREQDNPKKNRILYIVTVLKYAVLAFLIVLSYGTTGNIRYAAAGLFELILVIYIGYITSNYSRPIRILGNVPALILGMQFGFLYYSGSFVTVTMLQNIVLAEDLRGNGASYILSIIAIVVVSFIPVYIPVERKNKRADFRDLLIIVLLASIAFNGPYFAASGLRDLVGSGIRMSRMSNKNMDESANASFYNNAIQFSDYSVPEEMGQPNIILIFTEGMSEHIVDDSRNIMPNVRKFREQSISFERYFNHSFATFMGLQGQLFSGYQQKNRSINPYISLQDILHKNGYNTTLINTEPHNEYFTEFLETFGFDNLVTDTEKAENRDMTDKSAYEFLFDTAEELRSKEEPFFMTIYTFGTHVSFDSPDEKFGNGSDQVLNRFYNLDVQFGNFFEKYLASGMDEDTILIFTTDHATYADKDYHNAFPQQNRPCNDVDTIPLYIYHSGINPERIDVAGRNSLGFAPTVLDYLKISSENYFLGTSLFLNEKKEFETVFFDPSYVKVTEDGDVSDLYEYTGTEDTYKRILSYVLSLDNTLLKQDSTLNFEENEESGTIVITTEDKEYSNVRFAVWSWEYGQDDLFWVYADKGDDDIWRAEFNIQDLNSLGRIAVHFYEDSGFVSGDNLFNDEELDTRVLFDIDYDSDMLLITYCDDRQPEDVYIEVSGDGDNFERLNSEKNDNNIWQVKVKISDYIDSYEERIYVNVYVREKDGDFVLEKKLAPIPDKLTNRISENRIGNENQ